MNKYLSVGALRALALIVSSVSFIIVLAFVGLQAYVRWALNQNFMFLGGFEFEAITLGAFGLLIALLFARRE